MGLERPDTLSARRVVEREVEFGGISGITGEIGEIGWNAARGGTSTDRRRGKAAKHETRGQQTAGRRKGRN